MRIKLFYFLLLALLLFSCVSTPPPNYPLGWDQTKFKEKDGRLFYAVRDGTTTEVKAALKDGPNINVADYLGQTAFMWACSNGNLDIINALLDHDDTNRGKRKYKRLNIKATSKMSNPELNYNALFCYIMSNPSNYATQNTLTRIINIDRTILDMTDWYGETVIHKLVRSNNDYFDVVTKDMNKSKKNGLFNRKSNYGQSPLRLAVEFGNYWIIDALIDDDLVNDDIVIDDINDVNMPVYAFDQGNGDIDTFISLFQGKMKYDIKNNSGKRQENQQFEKAYEECFKENILIFWETYKKYLNTDITDPNDLIDEKYKSRINDIFDMLQKPKPMTDQDKQIFFNELEILPAALRETRNVKDMKKTVLQMVIENQEDTDVFERILKRNISLNKIRRPNNGTGDYLTIAMLNRKTKIMHFLLDNYSNPNYFIADLMDPNMRIDSTVAKATFGRDDLMDPLILFCTDKDLSGDRVLLRKMAKFYQSKYRDNDNYCATLLSELAKNEQFDIYKIFLDDYRESFYRVDKLNGEPVIKILLVNGKKGLVQDYIRHNKQRGLNPENEDALKKDKELWDEYNSLKTPLGPVSVQGRGR